MATNDGGPAFPHLSGETYTPDGAPGMTLRDYFAGQALVMAGVFRLVDNVAEEESVAIAKSLAERAYRLADAMITEKEGRATRMT